MRNLILFMSGALLVAGISSCGKSFLEQTNPNAVRLTYALH